ncbi:MAG: tryptophan-rich sensory protein [Candidatus Aenigmarchaeota archaeon]|nr:tryptophan-rich sensory protein [Candidatus Aenigmarchaeota archaeon]
MKVNFPRLIVSIVICQLAGIIGSFFTTPNIPTWYALVNKPWFNPPNWLFAPVWTTLFVLMGISLYLIWEKGLEKKDVRFAVSVFGIQLLFNVIWSVLFFGLQNPMLAFAEIIILWLSILATIVLFYKLSRPAALMLVPYIAWVTFAAVLNYYIWILNV